MLKKWLSEEQTTSMVGAVFDSAEDARSAADAVRSANGFEASDINVIRPGDPRFERKLEPESSEIAGTIKRAHLVLGLVGLGAGVVLSLLLVRLGVRPFEASPLLSVAVISGFAAVAGLLAGGMFSLRPDHDPVIERARRSTGEGRWFLLVHTRRPEQRERARSVLGDYSDDTIQTI